MATRYLNPMQGVISAYRLVVGALRCVPTIKATYSEDLDKCPYLMVGIFCALFAWLTNAGAPVLE
eukprot:4007283-Pyramimonas_sp.AAC.1